jgi:DNA invertase Pin-like site-specific DNA recombinase
MTQLEITDVGEPRVDSEETGDERFIALTHGGTLQDQEGPLRKVLAVADRVADADIGSAERTRVVRRVVNQEAETNPLTVGPGLVSWSCGDPGHNADGGIREAVQDGYSHLIVYNFGVLGRSVGAIADRVREAVDGGVTVHVVSQGFDVDDENVDTVLSVLDGLDAAGVELTREARVRDIQEWIGETGRPGRPPLGFDKIDGELVPADNMDEVRAVLSMNPGEEGDISKREAADRLGVSTRTIGRALDNLDRYGLNEDTGE